MTEQPSASRGAARHAASLNKEIFMNEESEEENADSEEEFILRLDPSDDDSESDEELELPTVPKKCHRTSDISMKWKNKTFHPKIYQFDSSSCGINPQQFRPSKNAKEIEFYQQILSEDIISAVARETNKYAVQFLAKNPALPSRSLMKKWHQLTVSELYLFIAITMLMVRNRKLKVAEYWSTDWLLSGGPFPKLMSRDRYLLILRMLHFADSKNQAKGGRLHKISSISDKFCSIFRSIFRPFQNLCIDESLILFKGRLGFKQYIRTKRHHFGIKLFLICDVKTGFILDVIIYTGKDIKITMKEELRLPGSIVMTLMEPYLDKGHSLFTDNWYTSPILGNELHKRKTNSCGTVSSRRKGMPQFGSPKKLHRGERQSLCTNNIMALRWQDKREVFMLTTLHKDTMKGTGKVDYATKEPIVKPDCVISYNASMGAVDLSDQLLSSVECVTKSTKWYKKLFFHFVDLTLLNAHVLFDLHFSKKTPIANYQLEVIRQLISLYQPQQIRLPVGGPTTAKADACLRLSERHFPAVIPPTEKNQSPLRVCRVCSRTVKAGGKRRISRYMCLECGIVLCIVPCFKIYHTVRNF